MNVPEFRFCGEVPEWPKGADCKSAAVRLRRFESCPLHHHAGIAQLVEREPSKLGVAGSSPVSRSISVLGPAAAQVAQSVEHVLGKDEVIGSIPIVGSNRRRLGADGFDDFSG